MSGRGNAARNAPNTSAGPWKSWRRMSRHARYIKFIERYCRPPKGKGHGQPLKLAGFQKSWLEEAFADDISTAVMPTPSGNGKSTFGGGVAVAATFMDDE